MINAESTETNVELKSLESENDVETASFISDAHDIDSQLPLYKKIFMEYHFISWFFFINSFMMYHNLFFFLVIYLSGEIATKLTFSLIYLICYVYLKGMFSHIVSKIIVETIFIFSLYFLAHCHVLMKPFVFTVPMIFFYCAYYIVAFLRFYKTRMFYIYYMNMIFSVWYPIVDGINDGLLVSVERYILVVFVLLVYFGYVVTFESNDLEDERNVTIIIIPVLLLPFGISFAYSVYVISYSILKIYNQKKIFIERLTVQRDSYLGINDAHRKFYKDETKKTNDNSVNETVSHLTSKEDNPENTLGKQVPSTEFVPLSKASVSFLKDVANSPDSIYKSNVLKQNLPPVSKSKKSSPYDLLKLSRYSMNSHTNNDDFGTGATMNHVDQTVTRPNKGISLQDYILKR